MVGRDSRRHRIQEDQVHQELQVVHRIQLVQGFQQVQLVRELQGLQEHQAVRWVRQVQQVQGLHLVQRVQGLQLHVVHLVQRLQQVQGVREVQQLQRLQGHQVVHRAREVQGVQQVQRVQGLQRGTKGYRLSWGIIRRTNYLDAGSVLSGARSSSFSWGSIVSTRSGKTRGSGVSSRSGRSWGSRWAVDSGGLALAPGRKSVVLTLLTEDAVEGVFTGLGWRSDGELNFHQLGPCVVSISSEYLNAVLNSLVHLIDGGVELRDDNKTRHNGEC